MSYVSSVSSDVTAYETVSLSGEVSFSGLGNGTDFSEIIDATIDAESYQLEAYEEQKTETEYIIDLLEMLDEELEDLNETLDDMDEPDEFFEMEGTSSGDEVTVELTGEADEGVHTLIVNQLAQKDVWVNSGDGFDSEDTVVAAAATTLELTLDGETISVEVAAGTTLEGLVNAVNNDVDARDRIEAELLYDGDEYYFKLSSEDAGADNAITIAGNAGLTGLTGFTNTQTAQNAQIKVDGFPPEEDEWIERATNSIDDVVAGITFELKESTDAEGVRISVEYDTDAMMEKIATFVESVNQIILDIQTLTGRVDDDEDEDTESYTVDNYAMDIIYNNIKNCISSGALGFTAYDSEDGGDYFNALSQIGISTDADEGSDTFGQLILDEDELEEAIETDPEAIGNLFSQRGVGESDTDALQVLSVIDTVTQAGTYDVQYTVESGVLTSATINGVAASVDSDNWTILGTSDSVSGLYMSVTDRTDGTHGGDVRVKQGIIGELSDILDGITDADEGSLPILIENYESSITALDNNIYNEEARLDALETSLTRKYAALDALLSEYENKSSLLSSLLSDL
ncbi:flagellar filament capping protein FliD [Pseudodesulfovibrio portus]|uniref:Flagellar hook-associated protein 2 n=1 Tax=Pseudodesulfovibrio portus TaxID=231439 RepID=A0ABN6RXT8_9BACT|nr:flagellar filament capping protein FliD [Pseudodesulfovibrio portus]BDQ35504.1 flagellar hook-associated protein 2 [Pseudodesulfovibrio portus]